MGSGVPQLRQVVLDAVDARALAEFYRQLLQLRYVPDDEPAASGPPDPQDSEWLVLGTVEGARVLAFQQVPELPRATWPVGEHPQMLHLDLAVPNKTELDLADRRALDLGATLLQDQSDHPEEPIRIYADPAGHPFCIFVAVHP